MDAAWVGLIGTLAGAIVAGLISIVLHFQSNRHALQTTKLTLAEERAKWATERQLDRLQKFHGTVEKVIAAAEQFRIQQAYETQYKDETPPKWVLSYEKARGDYEQATEDARSEISLLDEDIQTDFGLAQARYFEWMMMAGKPNSAGLLIKLEDDLKAFKTRLALHYRKIFDARRTGGDNDGKSGGVLPPYRKVRSPSQAIGGGDGPGAQA